MPRTYKPVPARHLRCRQCGADFVAKRSDAVYCSSACRVAVSRGQEPVPGATYVAPETLDDDFDPWDNPVDGPFWDTLPESIWPMEIRFARTAARLGLSVDYVRQQANLSSKDHSPEGKRKYLAQLAAAGIDPDEVRRKVEATNARVAEIMESLHRLGH